MESAASQARQAQVHQQLRQPLPFLLGAIAPIDAFRLGQFSDFSNPGEEFGMFSRSLIQARDFTGGGHRFFLRRRRDPVTLVHSKLVYSSPRVPRENGSPIWFRRSQTHWYLINKEGIS